MESLVSFKEFNRYVNNVLSCLANQIEKHEINNECDSSVYRGRSGSTKLEKDVIKPAITDENKIDIILKTNNLVKEFNLIDIIDPEIDDTESSKRSWADIILKVMINNVIVDVPVNIKATEEENSSYDNTASWKALSYIALENQHNHEIDILKEISINGINLNSVRDYFIWTFYKNEKRPFLGHGSFSLLQYEPKSYRYNRSQSFPIQINYKKCKPYSEDFSFGDRKKKLIQWMLDKNTEYFNNRLELNKIVFNKLDN
jgi:hypothetical protein